MSLLFVHLAEAHAEDEWPIGSPVQVLQHRHLQHRIAAAEQFYSALDLNDELLKMGVNMQMTVDTMENSFHDMYGSWPAQWFLAVPQAPRSQAAPVEGGGGMAAPVEGGPAFTMTNVSDYDSPLLTLDDFAAHMFEQFGQGEDTVGGGSTALGTVHGLPISAVTKGVQGGQDVVATASAAGTMQ